MNEYDKLVDGLLTNDLIAFSKLLRSENAVNNKNELGMNILHYYISMVSRLTYDPVEMVQLLIKNGVDINTQEKKTKLTPLRLAVTHKEIEICKTLIQNNCNIDLTDEYGNSPLMKAVSNYRGEKVEEDIIITLINGGADMDKMNNHNLSPRLVALRTGKNIDNGGNPKEWDVRPIFKELGINL